MIKYLKSLGFKVSNDLFATNSWYFRARLVEQGILRRVNGKRNGYWEITQHNFSE